MCCFSGWYPMDEKDEPLPIGVDCFFIKQYILL